MLFSVTFFSFCLSSLLTFQEYTEELRDIVGKSKKSASGGGVADGNITLINQRHVGDDLPVILKKISKCCKMILKHSWDFSMGICFSNGFGN